jgi:hypothetical protein
LIILRCIESFAQLIRQCEWSSVEVETAFLQYRLSWRHLALLASVVERTVLEEARRACITDLSSIDRLFNAMMIETVRRLMRKVGKIILRSSSLRP